MIFEQVVVLEGVDKIHPSHRMNFYANGVFNKTLFLRFLKNYKFHRPKIIGIVQTKDGRNDLFFYINGKDERRFASWRVSFGMKYWEDIVYEKKDINYDDKIRNAVV